MAYKMIVLDLDDTLLREDQTISERTKHALMEAQEMGVKVVLASGRPTFGMAPIAKELSLAEYGSYILSFNGGKIINCQTEEEIFSSTLSLANVRQLFAVSRREDVYIHTYVGDEILTDKENPFTTIESALTGLPVRMVDNFVDGVTVPVVKVLMVAQPEKLRKVEQVLQEELAEDYSIMRSKPFFLEFTEKGITKGESLNQLIKACGIKREEVIAIGDSYNDLSMIEFAGLGVAMGNAPGDIKEKADYVTDSNEHDGVAKVVEQFVLQNVVHV
ncbi:Cof-type HAD-IIB family hydrolase [Caldibacillus lycopersici]|uniref:Cof-type HAD-IIB family hydrolase n=1 Tax=Perspicuibacillus lycopersici TaxID=1325689 RepID=A0AAE3LNZ9_9BACI|nr:Cof-type HAD-IIB family hydrolase [Perspicuibacillus lycopersici]MCU9614397.1 Cof-type HAD-IIB family hydrolase [Perspicuibacillus lycopersici]